MQNPPTLHCPSDLGQDEVEQLGFDLPQGLLQNDQDPSQSVAFIFEEDIKLYNRTPAQITRYVLHGSWHVVEVEEVDPSNCSGWSKPNNLGCGSAHVC